MTTEQIIKGNKIIAHFLGYKPYDNGDKRYSPEDWYCGHDVVYGQYKDLDYHCEWGWIMPVVEMIEAMGYSIFIQNDACWIKPARPSIKYTNSILGESKIEAVWGICVEFARRFGGESKD